MCQREAHIGNSVLVLASALLHLQQPAFERISMVNRRVLLSWLGAAGACALAPAPRNGFSKNKTTESAGGWEKFPGNPVLGGHYGTCFDICVLREEGRFRMWLSWRPRKSVALSESKDGILWSAPEIVLGPNPASGWESEINRPVVVRRAGGYHMWYTGQIWSKQPSPEGRLDGHSYIGYATSADGKSWIRKSAQPVLSPELPWEDVALMCPDVLWDEKRRQWRMWYSGGAQYEPNAVGHASSSDGLHWVKDAANPIFRPNPQDEWEKERVAGIQVLRLEEWFYAFYIGYRDIDHAQIGLARSEDGLHNWERFSANPIIHATGTGFDAEACYKPYAVWSGDRWMLWYNGRNEHLEQIGLATLHRRNLWDGK
jgi:beta-1,2-mannobiose phosphorylase / 1,2-beta-oligomannan phosphorylase